MVMGELAESADVLVIGGGPAGYTCAIRLAQLGRQVTVVEREGIGGLCLFHGCIPSKALIHAASVLQEIRESEELGISVENVRVDWGKTQAWKSKVIQQLNTGLESLFRHYNIEIVRGNAFFESPKRVGISTGNGVTAIEFNNAVVATGSTPRKIPELAFDGKVVLTSREALALPEIPKSIAVFGGGYVGIELGTVFAKMGSKVYVFEHGPRIMAAADPEAASIVHSNLAKMGVEFFFNSKTEGCTVGPEGAVIRFSSNGSTGELGVEKVLVAVGHTPTTSELRLQNAAVELDERGFIKIDGRMQTTSQKIYAIGDVTGHPMLAHKGYKQGRIAAEAIAGKDVVYDVKAMPAVVFSDPEVASVGLQEHEAAAKGASVIVGKFPLRALGRALASNKPDGYVKIIADSQTHAVLGGTMVGAAAADLVGEIALAVESGLLLEDIAATIHTHPTFPEALAEACEVALGEAVHVPKKK